MLEKNPRKRITIEELKAHKWVNKFRDFKLNEKKPDIITLSEEEVQSSLNFFQKFALAVTYLNLRKK
jgi:hypothetical protein